MSKMIDLTGKRFGKLYVLKRVENATSCNSRYTETRWLCKCDCGKEVIVRMGSLLYHAKDNCGCVKKLRPVKHGMSHTPIHQKRIGMKDRCYNKNDSSYPNYGGRGITVCNEWLGKNGFQNFYKWAKENGWSEESKGYELTIDRIDVNGNYCPENCRLVGKQVQANNTRKTFYVQYGGEQMPFSQFCKKYNLNYNTAYGRYMSGYSTEEILNVGRHEKSGSKIKVVKIDPKTRKCICIYNSTREAARENGLKCSSSITDVCKGKKKSAAGYVWMYYDDFISFHKSEGI